MICSSVSLSRGMPSNMSPSNPCVYCTRSAVFNSRSPCILSIWPSHLKRRFFTAWTKSYVRVLGLASSCVFLPVNRLSMRAVAPFNIAAVLSSIAHASHPYVNTDPIAVLYIRILRPNDMPELNTCRNVPILAVARAILRWTSHSSLPSAVKIDPRYLNLNTFF